MSNCTARTFSRPGLCRAPSPVARLFPVVARPLAPLPRAIRAYAVSEEKDSALAPTADPEPSSSSSGPPSATSDVSGPIIAAFAVVAGVALFAGTRGGGSAVTLAALAAESIPLDEALQSGRPTVLEARTPHPLLLLPITATRATLSASPQPPDPPRPVLAPVLRRLVRSLPGYGPGHDGGEAGAGRSSGRGRGAVRPLRWPRLQWHRPRPRQFRHA